MKEQIKILLILIFISTFAVNFPQSNEFKLETLTVNNGLSHNSGLCLLQDRIGFLWIGTQNGLCRYDGYSIKKFIHSPEDSTSISGNYINSLFEDKSGIIWVGTNKGGINKYNPVNEKFTVYKNKTDDPNSIGFGSVYSINEDRYGNLWVAVNPTGLFMFDKAREKFYHFKENPENSSSIKGERAFCLYNDSEEILWIGTDKGLNKLSITEKVKGENSNANDNSIIDRYNFNFINWRHNPKIENSIVNDNVISIAEEKSTEGKKIWIGTDDGLSKMEFTNAGKVNFINYKNNPDIPNSISNNTIWSLCIDSKGNLWIGTKNGLNKFRDKKNDFEKFNFDQKNKKSFNYTVRYIFEDRTGVLWCGTENSAVLKLIELNKNFRVIKNNPLNKSSLSDNNVTSVCEDKKGNLWVGTKFGGLNKISFDKNEKENYTHYYNDPLDKKSLLDNHVKTIFEDSKSILWIGSWNSYGGLNRFEEETNGFAHYQNNSSNPNSLSDNQVRSIAEDNEGSLWIGLSETGIDKFDRKSKKFVNYHYDPDNTNSLSDISVTDIFSDNDFLWIATYNGGLNRFNLKTKKFTHYKFNTENEYCISSNRIWIVYKDSYQRIWIGTNNGLNYFDKDTERFISFKEADGLINNTVLGILEDDQNNLWLSTQNGISKMEILSSINNQPEKIRFTNYDSEDHPAISEFNANSCFKRKSGELLFGGVNGLVHFFPDSIVNNSNIPEIVITSFKIYEKETVLDTSIILKERLEIPYHNNFFSFEFTALDFHSSNKNQYAYMLEGLNNDWIYSGNRRFVSFSHLDPGEYIFRVKASNNDDVWNETGTSLAILITPPFYMTTWFRILSGILFLISLVFSVRYISTQKLRKKLREAEVKQKLQYERERISKDLHDNIGSNLTSIITGLEISKRYFQRDDKNNLIKNITTLESHTRNTIDELRQTIWSLHKDINTLKELNEKIKEYILHKLKFEEHPKTRFHFEGDENFKLSSSQALNLFRIVQEAVNNSIKYSNSNNINVEIKTNDDLLTLIINDDGTGFELEKIKEKSDGMGIGNLKQRAASINSIINIDSRIGKGTTVTIELNSK